MNETVKLRKVGAALVMGIPRRIADAFECAPGDFVNVYHRTASDGSHVLTVIKEPPNGRTKKRRC